MYFTVSFWLPLITTHIPGGVVIWACHVEKLPYSWHGKNERLLIHMAAEYTHGLKVESLGFLQENYKQITPKGSRMQHFIKILQNYIWSKAFKNVCPHRLEVIWNRLAHNYFYKTGYIKTKQKIYRTSLPKSCEVEMARNEERGNSKKILGEMQ